LSLLGMLGSSALFRHTPLRWSNYRWFLRRLDHAAIFLFIAGTYTPFTVGQMQAERVGPTVAVWAGALIGVAYKLAFPVGLRRPSLAAFAALASFVLFGLRPTLVSMAPLAVGLILAGVALYMVGAAIHHRPMPFHTPIWHGFVIVGAGCHRGPCRCGARARLERRSDSQARGPSSRSYRSRPGAIAAYLFSIGN
jgi:hemolysin III